MSVGTIGSGAVLDIDRDPPTTWYAITGSKQPKGHLPRFYFGSAIATHCGMSIRGMERFEPAHDGQTCWRCVPAAVRFGVTVEMPGYPNGTAGGPVEPPHVLTGARR